MPLKTTEIPAQALRREAGDLLGRIQYQHERVTITKHGKPIVAMVPIEDLALIESASKKVRSDQSEAVSINPANIGGDFDDFLRSEGIYDEVKASTRKKVAAWVKLQQAKAMVAMPIKFALKPPKRSLKPVLKPALKPAIEPKN
jgi:prevent-host-death family protein